MATSDHKGALIALERTIDTQRAELIRAQAVQRCVYEVLLYVVGEDAFMYAKAARLVTMIIQTRSTNSIPCTFAARCRGATPENGNQTLQERLQPRSPGRNAKPAFT
jgi:hypothetical protein